MLQKVRIVGLTVSRVRNIFTVSSSVNVNINVCSSAANRLQFYVIVEVNLNFDHESKILDAAADASNACEMYGREGSFS